MTEKEEVRATDSEGGRLQGDCQDRLEGKEAKRPKEHAVNIMLNHMVLC